MLYHKMILTTWAHAQNSMSPTVNSTTLFIFKSTLKSNKLSEFYSRSSAHITIVNFDKSGWGPDCQRAHLMWFFLYCLVLLVQSIFECILPVLWKHCPQCSTTTGVSTSGSIASWSRVVVLKDCWLGAEFMPPTETVGIYKLEGQTGGHQKDAKQYLHSPS